MIKLFKIALALLFFACANSFYGQEYKIDVTIEGLKDTTVLLGHHFGSKKYVVDTMVVDSKGHGTFVGDTALKKGMYLVILPKMSYFEIIIDDDQKFSISTKDTDMLKNIAFKGSEQNSVFTEYQRFMVKNQTKAKELRTLLTTHKEKAELEGISESQKKIHTDSTEILKEQLKEINDGVQDYWNKIIEKHKGTLLSAILKTLKDIDIPDAPEGVEDSKEYQYRYYRKHYFDNIDFTDHRLLRTPFLENKIESYLKLPVLQIPDSLIVEIDRIIKLSEGDKEVNQYVIQHFFNKLQGNEQMCMDKALFHIIDKYYTNGKAPWAEKDEEFMKKLIDRKYKMMYNQCGATAPNLALLDTLGKKVNTNAIEADYTVLYFFEPGCGHCKKLIPQWHELYQELDKSKVKTILVYTQGDKEEWLEFIHEHQLYDVVNLYDPTDSTNFRVYYDIYSTPTSYILNKDKEIVAKRIGPETIRDFIKRMIEIDEEKKDE